MNVLDKIEDDFEWYSNKFLKDNKFKNFKETLMNLHNPENKNDIFSNDFRRIAYDEIFSNLLTLFNARVVIKIKKKKKNL